jgi:formate hydrogenlyase subunit 4
VAWVLGLVAWALKMGALCLALAVFESAIAKMRVFRVPEFLGAALLLALLAAALLFVSTGLA